MSHSVTDEIDAGAQEGHDAEAAETGPGSMQTTRYVLRKPDGTRTVVAETTILDTLDRDIPHTITTYEVQDAACCGARTCSDESARGWPKPGGSCPSCGAVLCAKHLAEDQCAVCSKVLCRTCRRIALHLGGLSFCEPHFKEMVTRITEEDLKCLDQKPYRCGRG